LIKIILLLGLGLVLIIAEVLVPSMGILGILAALCIIGAVAWAFAVSTTLGIGVLASAGLLAPLFLMLAFKLLPKSPLAKKLIAGGFTFEDGVGVDARDRELMGQVGTVEAPLRPVGAARLAGRRVDVTSRGELIEVGAPVRVIDVQGNRVLVVRADEGREET